MVRGDAPELGLVQDERPGVERNPRGASTLPDAQRLEAGDGAEVLPVSDSEESDDRVPVRSKRAKRGKRVKQSTPKRTAEDDGRPENTQEKGPKVRPVGKQVRRPSG